MFVLRKMECFSKKFKRISDVPIRGALVLLLCIFITVTMSGCIPVWLFGQDAQSQFMADNPIDHIFVDNESKGVPDQQIQEKIADIRESYKRNPYKNLVHIGEFSEFTYTHDVDKVLHRDTVSISFSITDNFLVEERVEKHIYVYDKVSDTWSLSDEHIPTDRYWHLREDLVGGYWADLDYSKSKAWRGATNALYSIEFLSYNKSGGYYEFEYFIGDHISGEEFRGTAHWYIDETQYTFPEGYEAYCSDTCIDVRRIR